MACCCPHSQSAGRCFSFFARRYRRRFQRKGLEPSQKQLIAGLEQVGYAGATLLEIGCGVGYLHQTLLERGAASAIGVDLAPKMLAEARAWAGERGLSDRSRYVEGDFVEIAHEVGTADIAILDKVVCCYPDAMALVQSSLAKTRRVYALTYPRSRWFTRLGAVVGALAMRLLRSAFRSYVHDPVEIEDWITAQGFEKRYENQTAIWLTQVYVRR